MIKSKTKITIPFNDLDPMNIVWHGNYAKYLEQARCELFKKLGYTYLDMYNDNYMYPIAKFDMKFIKPVTLDDEISVECTLLEIEPSMIITYEIFNTKTGEKIFKAKTMQIGVLVDTKQSVYVAPKKLVEIFKDYGYEK